MLGFGGGVDGAGFGENRICELMDGACSEVGDCMDDVGSRTFAASDDGLPTRRDSSSDGELTSRVGLTKRTPEDALDSWLYLRADCGGENGCICRVSSNDFAPVFGLSITGPPNTSSWIGEVTFRVNDPPPLPLAVGIEPVCSCTLPACPSDNSLLRSVMGVREVRPCPDVGGVAMGTGLSKLKGGISKAGEESTDCCSWGA